MNPLDRTQQVEEIVGYRFTEKNLLVRALKSAGVEEDDYDGNRFFARLGNPLIELCHSQTTLVVEASAEDARRSLSNALSTKGQETIARAKGIDRCITLCPRQAEPSPKTLSVAVRAIIGAVYLDSGKQVDTVLQALKGLSLFTEPEAPASSSRLSSNQASPPERASTHDLDLDFPDLGEFLDLDQYEFNHENLDIPAYVPLMPTTLSAIDEPSTTQSSIRHGSSTWGSHSETTNDTWHSAQAQDLAIDPILDVFLGGDISLNAGDCIISGESSRHDTNRTRGARDCSLKRKPRSDGENELKRPKDGHDGSTVLVRYISTERLKCEQLSLEFAEDLYLLPDLISQNEATPKPDQVKIAQGLFAGICSAESIIQLQTFVLDERTKPAIERMDLFQPLSSEQRLAIIEQFGVKIAFLGLLRRYHILKLYTDSAHASPEHEDSFVVNTDEQCFLTPRNRPGNPRYRAAAEATLAMSRQMQSSSPDQEVSKPAYSAAKRWRKLGERLHMLTERFGYSILALLPPVISDEPTLTVSDDKLLRLVDPIFQQLVDHLDNAQGVILRQFAKKIDEILQTTLSGDLKENDIFALEVVNKGDILRCPKGSKQLLELLGGS